MADTLFDFDAPQPAKPAPGISSGPVPRIIAPGVVWGSEAEAHYAAAVEENRKTFGGKWTDPKFAPDVEREARWSVEIWLHQQFTKARMKEWDAAWEPAEKRALTVRWRKEYGDARTEGLLTQARSEQFRRVVREKW